MKQMSIDFGKDYTNEELSQFDWGDISINQILTESDIVKYKIWLDSYYISSNQKLSEPFIAEHKDWLNHVRISQYQNLSEPFIAEHKDWLEAIPPSAQQRRVLA